MTSGRHVLLLLALAILAGACGLTKPYYAKSEQAWAEQVPPASAPAYRVFLVGDAGRPDTNGKDPLMLHLQDQLQRSGAASTVVFLGDNIYPYGLPPEGDKLRAQSEARIMGQLQPVREHPGKVIFIPGNHDWNKSKKGGWAYIQREAEFIENILKTDEAFLPNNGCPGPATVPLTDSLVLLVIDSEWWLHRWEKPTKEAGCLASTQEEFLQALDAALVKQQGKRIIVVAHHPVFTQGKHGGHFPVKDHLFPLANIQDWLYVPLPGLGSIFPLYRKWFGARQDLAHPQNRAYTSSMVQHFEAYPGLIYAAGHEHNLQYYQQGQQHYLVSGAGSKGSHLKGGGTMQFGSPDRGYAALDYYSPSEVWVTFFAWQEDASGRQTAQTVFRKRL